MTLVHDCFGLAMPNGVPLVAAQAAAVIARAMGYRAEPPPLPANAENGKAPSGCPEFRETVMRATPEPGVYPTASAVAREFSWSRRKEKQPDQAPPVIDHPTAKGDNGKGRLSGLLEM